MADPERLRRYWVTLRPVRPRFTAEHDYFDSADPYDVGAVFKYDDGRGPPREWVVIDCAPK